MWEADGDDYRMTFVSPRTLDIAGYPPETWLTEPEFWERHLHPDDRERAMAVTDAAIKALNSIRLEYRFRIANGEYRWFSDVIRVIRKADGSGHRLVGVMIDITDQKRIEETLAYRASHDTLTGLLNREQLDIELERASTSSPNRGLCCSSTSTASRTSMTVSVTRSGMRSSASLRSDCRLRRVPTTSLLASVVMSFASWRPSRNEKRPSPSRNDSVTPSTARRRSAGTRCV